LADIPVALPNVRFRGKADMPKFEDFHNRQEH